MAKYKIIPSSRTIVQSPISIGHKAEKGVEAIEFDLTAWVETYGSGTLTVIMRRWGDAIPYPIALEIDENNKATWVLSDTDTAKAGMAYAQLSYIVGETVVKKSDIYTFRVMDSLTGEGEPPEAYESWLEHLTHLAAEAMAEVLDIESIVTDKTLTVDGGIADAKATGDALALKADKSTTYTKTEVDALIDEVEVETDTTLAVSGAPADSKKVGDELTTIKADLDAFQTEGDITDFTISQGTITMDGYNNSSTTRCKTSYIEFAGTRLVVTPKDGYKISSRVYTAKSLNSFDHGDSEWSTTPLTFTDSTMFYRIVIAISDDSAITPSELPEDVITVKYYATTDKTLTIEGVSADAGEVGTRIATLQADLEEQIESLSGGVSGFTAEKHVTKWKSGTLNTSTGAESGSKSNRSFTNEKLYFGDTVDGIVTICTSADYCASIRAYRVSDDGYAGMPYEGFVAGEYELTINPEYYYRFVLARNDDGNFLEKNIAYTDLYFTFTTANEQLDVIRRNNKIETVALLQQLNRKTRVSKDTWGKAPLCFIHFSDIHGDPACLSNIVKFKAEYSAYISDILHTGDSVHYESADGMGFWNGIEGSEYILNTIGNHDTNVKVGSSYVWTSLSMADSYSTYMAPYIANWGCTYTADQTYYYKDYTAEGVRLIVLDIMHQTAEQLAWFEFTLASARTAELDVVVAVHSKAHWLMDRHDSVWDDKVNVPSYDSKNYDTSAQTGSTFPENLAGDYASAVDDFIDAGGYFICWLHGHTHFRMLVSLQSYPEQLDIAVANAGGTNYANTYVWEKINDTKSMDDFNVVAIDTTGKILRIAKIGVNTDRLMRVAHTMSYNYKTHTIINAN